MGFVTKTMHFLIVILLTNLALCHCAFNEEIIAGEYLKQLNPEIIKYLNLEAEAYWDFDSNVTDHNERKKHEASAEWAKFIKQVVEDIKKFNWKTFQSDDLKRQFRMLSQQATLPEKEYLKLLQSTSSMESNFAKTRICDYETRKKCDLSLEPEIEEIISKSRDPEKLKYYWREFYDKVGTPSRSSYEKYVELSNKDAKLKGFKNAAEMWLDKYEDPTMEKQVENILETVKPLYLQIHAYVRHRLRQYYGRDLVSESGPIPMHLLNNLWSEQWNNIADIVLPFPSKPLLDVSKEMMKQDYTPLKMFQMGDDFFTSMGLKALPQLFWNRSIFEKPSDGRNLICVASSWDFYLKNDVRIKQCTHVNQDQLFTVHHELGHIQYFLQYQHQPILYRDGANPGFHEAIGDVIALSVSTPKHLKHVNLLKNYMPDNEARIKRLFLLALDKIMFLPFAFILDKYRWSLFRGEVDKSQWNCAFWKLHEQYSGIEPPVVRTENDFDAPAKYHVSAGIEYLRYFVSFIIQFQFYKSACLKAGQYDPSNPELSLDNCDIYGSQAAGESFAKMLSLGSSKPWPDAMEAFAGERNMSANAIVDYFQPLCVWLEAENKKNNVTIGWTKSDKCVAA